MPNVELKQTIVDEIKSKLDGASSIVLVDYRGLTVEEDTKLRKDLREGNVLYKVYKNTMMNFAFKGTEFEELKDHLEGPSAVAISYEDPTAGPRILKNAAKDFKNLDFKAGVVEGTYYDVEGIKKIASIPARDELLAKLLGSFQSPISTFARTVKAIADKAEETGAETAAVLAANKVEEKVEEAQEQTEE
ncbi:50S ribosomal protein L10 [Vallitalea sp.]|jgi:large subunit ribosomal protein L10|uniref:50S ribosomal protein L10 n=1 Tax=Vallitalea sp. TaxID=1882829 RepID=UPI0025F13951|nr:50S ribosomal protein L10 [Vallitalea sp.]MCT4686261.1 50S ribosomal protein L10 [Vallitalea sp.]